MAAGCFGQAQARGNAEMGGVVLQKDQHQGREGDHPEKGVTVQRAGSDVGSPVARVDEPDGDHEPRPQVAQQLTREEVAAKGEGLQVAQALAQKVAKQSPVAVSYSKQLIQAARHTPPAQNLIHEREAFVKLFDTMDQREGVQAFLDKRKPNWQNK